MDIDTLLLSPPKVANNIPVRVKQDKSTDDGYLHKINVESSVIRCEINHKLYGIINNELHYLHQTKDGQLEEIKIGKYIKTIGRIYQERSIVIIFEFISIDNTKRTATLPAGLIKSPLTLNSRLANLGYSINSTKALAASALCDYLMEDTRDVTTFMSVIRTGWLDGNFILPNKIIGINKLNYYYLGTLSDKVTQSRGTLKEWQDNIALNCIGKGNIEFAIFFGFSAISANITKQGYMIHYVGDSSIGKSTISNIVASIFGNREHYTHSWNATENALQEIVLSYQNIPIILDEAARYEGKFGAGFESTAYNLCSPENKLRTTWSNQSGIEITYKEKKYPRIFSTGEIPAIAMSAGQLMRFINIEITKIFDTAQQAELLNQNTFLYHGTASIAFIQWLIDQQIDLLDEYEKTVKELRKKYKFLNSQQERGLCYFAEILSMARLVIKSKVLPDGFRSEVVIDFLEEWLKSNSILGQDRILLQYLYDCVMGNLGVFLVNNSEFLKETATTVGYFHDDRYFLKLRSFVRVLPLSLRHEQKIATKLKKYEVVAQDYYNLRLKDGRIQKVLMIDYYRLCYLVQDPNDKGTTKDYYRKI